MLQPRERRRRTQAQRDVCPPPPEPISSESSPAVSDEPTEIRPSELSKTRPTESLWTKLSTMSDRIHALEDALQMECTARQALERIVNSQLSRADEEGTSKETVVTDLKEMPLNEPQEEPLTVDAVHPLLVSNLLDVKKGIERYASPLVETKNTESGNTDEMTCAFGMLSIRDGHYSRFMGAFAAEVRFSLFAYIENV